VTRKLRSMFRQTRFRGRSLGAERPTLRWVDHRFLISAPPEEAFGQHALPGPPDELALRVMHTVRRCKEEQVLGRETPELGVTDGHPESLRIFTAHAESRFSDEPAEPSGRAARLLSEKRVSRQRTSRG
jgi:hypothetical protein